MERPSLEEIYAEEDPVHRAILRDQRQRAIDNLFQPIHTEVKVEYDWLVEGFLPKGYLAILAGEPKSGKTCLATSLALAVATGTPFAGMPTEQSGVLWLSLEEGYVERRKTLDLSPLSETTTPLYTCYQRLAIDVEDDLIVLFESANRHKAGLIVVDPLHCATSGRSLADGWAARKTLQLLKQYCALQHITALVLHHSKRPAYSHRRPRVAESDQLAATASMHIVLTSRPKPPLPFTGEGAGGGGSVPPRLSGGEGVGGEGHSNQQTRLVTLHMQGRGDFANRSLHLHSPDPLSYFQSAEEETTPQPKLRLGPVETAIIEHLASSPLTADQLAELTNTGMGTLYNALARLRSKGIIRQKGSKPGQRYYELIQSAWQKLASEK